MAALGFDSCEKNYHHPFFQKVNYPQCTSFLGSTGMIMDRYHRLNVISNGSYGVVYRAWDRKTGEIVAMKKEFDGFSLSTLREIGILMSLPRHPSIVDFKDIFEDGCGRVFVVMEYMESDLKRLMDVKRKPFTLSEVKYLMKQILQGVNFLHQNGVIHRDLKPSNILINNKAQLKICDFGLSRHLGKASGSYTPGVVTLWYRAPELLLGADTYSCAIDTWSVGCIMAELVMNEVLFQGRSEVHQLGCIHQIVGIPCMLRLKVAAAASVSGAPLLTNCGFDLLERLLACDPDRRITAQDALNHSWFKEYYGLSV